MLLQDKLSVRQQLLAKLDELDRRDGRDELIRERCNDPMDQVQTRFEMDMAISVINTDFQTRRKVAKALKLLEIDEYGICQDCGAEINPKRLDAIPWTTLCVYCQEEYDSSSMVGSKRYRRAA